MRNIKKKFSFALSLVLLMTQTAISIPVRAATTEDTPVVIVKEDWNDYAIGDVLGTGTTINGGFGFSSGAYGSASGTGKNVINQIPGAKSTERAVSMSGSGSLAKRPLAYQLSTTTDNEFYVKWTGNAQGLINGTGIVGIAFNDHKVGVGIAKDGTTNKLATYTGASRVFTYDDADYGTTSNSPRVFIAKFTIDADGMDSISLKTYDATVDASLAGEDGLIYPTEWDMTTEYELGGYVFNNMTVWGFCNTGAHIGGIYIYKKANEMTETDIENHMNHLISRLPAAADMTLADIDANTAKIEDITAAAEKLEIDPADYDVDGKWAKYLELTTQPELPDATVVLAMDDWSDYAVGEKLGANTAINGGFGFKNGKWTPSNSDAHIIEKYPTGSAERAIGATGNSVLVGRELEYTLSTTKDNEFYVKWIGHAQALLTGTSIMGVAFDQYKVGVGIGPDSSTQNSIVSWDGNGSTRNLTKGDVKMVKSGEGAVLNDPKVFIAKFTIDADGDDTVQLKTYDVTDASYDGEKGLLYPEEWDLTKNYDLSGYTFDDVSLWLRGTAYIGGIYIYKKANKVLAEERSTYMTLLEAELPATEDLTAENVYNYAEQFASFKTAATNVGANPDDYAKVTAFEELLAEAETAKIYVAPNGDDKNIATADAPVKTIDKALEKLATIRTAYPKTAVDVIFKAGEYFVEDVKTLTEENVGTSAAPVNFKAETGAEVVLTGAKGIASSLFSTVTDSDELYAKIPEAARDSVQVATLPDDIKLNLVSDPGHDGGDAYKYNSLFANGSEETIARWPNEGYETLAWENVNETVTAEGANGGFKLERAKNWGNYTTVMMNNFFSKDYRLDRAVTKSINTTDGIVEVYNVGGAINETATRRFWVYNLIEELDQAGEWFINGRKLYYYPEGDLSATELEISQNTTGIFKLDGVSNIGFSGITFAKTRGDVITANGAADISIDACEFNDIGRYAIKAEGAENFAVADSSFYNLGNTGVYLDGGDAETLTASGNTVTDCQFEKFSQYRCSYAPAISIKGVGATVSGNTISDSPHEAIELLGNDIIIEKNTIYNVCLDTDDCGAIYSGKSFIKRGNVIRDNYIYNVKNDYFPNSKGAIAIYFDDFMSGGEIYNNLIKNSGKGISIHGGHDNYVHDNVITGCQEGISISHNGNGLGETGFYKTLRDEAVSYSAKTAYKKYAGLENVTARGVELTGSATYPRGNVIENNVGEVVASANVETADANTTENLTTKNFISENYTTAQVSEKLSALDTADTATLNSEINKLDGWFAGWEGKITASDITNFADYLEVKKNSVRLYAGDVQKASLGAITENKNAVRINVNSGKLTEGKLYAAIYTADGRLYTVSVKDLADNTYIYDFNFDLSAVENLTGYTVKAFIWTTGQKPLTGALDTIKAPANN